jgi:hypothetical protein
MAAKRQDLIFFMTSSIPARDLGQLILTLRGREWRRS